MLIQKDKARAFFASRKFPESVNGKFEKLAADYLATEAEPPFGDRQLTAGLTWAIVFVNTVLDHSVTIEEVATHFELDPVDVDDAAAEVMLDVKFLDRRYLTDEAAKAVQDQVPAIRALDPEDPSSVEGVFEEGLRLHDSEEHFDAMVVFYSILDTLDRLGKKVSKENRAAYTCACLSNIGHIFWELEEFDSARSAFEEGITAAEAAFGPLDKAGLDFHEESHGPVIFLLEDIASLDYMEGDAEAAKKWFTLLKAADPHGHLGADLALECLSAGMEWEQYVEKADAVAAETHGDSHEHSHDHGEGHECDCENCEDENCECGENKEK